MLEVARLQTKERLSAFFRLRQEWVYPKMRFGRIAFILLELLKADIQLFQTGFMYGVTS